MCFFLHVVLIHSSLIKFKMVFKSGKSEIQAIKSDNSIKAQVTILETEFKKHVNDFMMIQSMNDANSMQHEEARRMAMKAVKSRLDEIQRKFRLDYQKNYLGGGLSEHFLTF